MMDRIHSRKDAVCGQGQTRLTKLRDEGRAGSALVAVEPKAEVM
jgi:hypothetical protein